MNANNIDLRDVLRSKGYTEHDINSLLNTPGWYIGGPFASLIQIRGIIDIEPDESLFIHLYERQRLMKEYKRVCFNKSLPQTINIYCKNPGALGSKYPRIFLSQHGHKEGSVYNNNNYEEWFSNYTKGVRITIMDVSITCNIDMYKYLDSLSSSQSMVALCPHTGERLMGGLYNNTKLIFYYTPCLSEFIFELNRAHFWFDIHYDKISIDPSNNIFINHLIECRQCGGTCLSEIAYRQKNPICGCCCMDTDTETYIAVGMKNVGIMLEDKTVAITSVGDDWDYYLVEELLSLNTIKKLYVGQSNPIDNIKERFNHIFTGTEVVIVPDFKFADWNVIQDIQDIPFTECDIVFMNNDTNINRLKDNTPGIYSLSSKTSLPVVNMDEKSYIKQIKSMMCNKNDSTMVNFLVHINKDLNRLKSVLNNIELNILQQNLRCIDSNMRSYLQSKNIYSVSYDSGYVPLPETDPCDSEYTLREFNTYLENGSEGDIKADDIFELVQPYLYCNEDNKECLKNILNLYIPIAYKYKTSLNIDKDQQLKHSVHEMLINTLQRVQRMSKKRKRKVQVRTSKMPKKCVKRRKDWDCDDDAAVDVPLTPNSSNNSDEYSSTICSLL